MMRVEWWRQAMARKDGHIRKWLSVAIIGCLANKGNGKISFSWPIHFIVSGTTNIWSAMTKNPSLLRHKSFRTFGLERAPFWCLVHEGCLKTYVLISKQYYVCVCWGRRNNAHVKRRGWNNHPFNSRIPADAIFIVLIDCDYSDSWCARDGYIDVFDWESMQNSHYPAALLSFRFRITMSHHCLHDPVMCKTVSFLTVTTNRNERDDVFHLHARMCFCPYDYKTWCRFVYLAR